jgi:hypothetical protein
VLGNVDYNHFRDLLERISEVIKLSGLDFFFVDYLVKETKKIKSLGKKEQSRLKIMRQQAFRCAAMQIQR